MAQGISLQLTHTGLTPSSLLIKDVEAATDGPAGYKKSGPVYVPYMGSVTLIYSSLVAKSFEAGDIRGFIGNGHLTASFIVGTSFGNTMAPFLRVGMPISPGNTVEEVLWIPSNSRILGIEANIETGAVTAGTYTLAVTGAGVNLLSAATFDLTTLVAQTITNIPLTATVANLLLSANDRIVFSIASSLGDLTGAGLSFSLKFALR